MRKTLLILLTPLCIFSLMAGVFQYFLFPKIDHWARQEIATVSETEWPVKIEIEALDIGWLRPSLIAKNIVITPKEDLQKILAPVTITEARAYLDIFKLIIGRLEVSYVAVDTPTTKLSVDPLLEGPSQPKKIPVEEIYRIANLIPIHEIILKEADVSISSEKYSLATRLEKGDLHLSKEKRSLNITVRVPQTDVVLEDKTLTTALTLKAQLKENTLNVEQASVKLDENSVNAQAIISNFSQVQLDPTLTYKLKANLDFSSAMSKMKILFQKFPAMKGSVELETTGEVKPGLVLENIFSINTKDVSVAEFAVGSAELKGKIENNKLSVTNLSLEHPAGVAVVQSAELDLKTPYAFKVRALISQFSLLKLFENINLPEVPVELVARGNGLCHGQLANSFYANCETNIDSNYLLVATGKDSKDPKIIELDAISAKGQVNFNSEGLKFKAQLKLKEANAQADGEVLFKEGFNINFSSDPIDFVTEVKNLGGLTYKGQFTLDGFTKGDSSAAIFESKSKLKNFYLEKYFLGDLETKVRYEKGHLKFLDNKGHIDQTTYVGNIDVNFNKNSISGQINSDNADLKDIQKASAEIVSWPISISGIGPVGVYFDGPFSFWNMNLKVQSHFLKVHVAGDSVDRLQVNLDQQDGLLKFSDVYALKNRSRLNATGFIDGPRRSFELKMTGNALKLEESEFVSRISSNISGNLNIVGDLTGSFSAPITRIAGTLSETIIEEQSFPSSTFEMKFLRDRWDGIANIMGNKIQTNFSIPYQEGNSPFILKAKTSSWSFSSLLALIGAQSLQNQYETQLTSDIDLRSDSGDPFRSTGKINIQKIYLKRGDQSLSNAKPIQITFNNGHGELDSFALEGPQNQISIQSPGFTSNQLNFNVQANVSLRLMHVLVPFLEDLNGKVEASAKIAGSLQHPEIFGSAKAQDVFVKLKGFPHPVEKLNGDLSFSHTRITLNNFKGQLSGGLLSAEGLILIRAFREFPTNIKMKLNGVNLQIPERVKTTGDGDLTFSGAWFPFVLSGVYNVTSAYIDKDFGSEDATTGTARQSIYLPKSLKESAFEPVLLDLQVLVPRNGVIKNRLVDGNFTADLTVKGPPSAPILGGKVNLEKGSHLLFKDKVFEVQTGLIQFFDPKEINPELYISATTRVAEYDINLLVQGTKSNLTIKTSSSPPLSEPDIFTLLALGVTSTKLDQTYSANQQQQTGYEIGSAIISQTGIDRQLKERLGVNFQFGTSFDTTKNVSVPKITISRNIRKKLDASFSRTLGDQNVNEARLQYSINNNVSAIGSWQAKEAQEGSNTRFNEKETEILGVDLEFKREFK